jgi:tetratricopeptide (TPR) repeat protein
LNTGVALFVLERYDQAIECFNKVFDKVLSSSRNESTWFKALAGGKYNEIVEFYDKYLKDNAGL